MKKNILLLVLVILFGVFSGKMLYKKLNQVYAFAPDKENKIYLLQLGVYQDEETMKRDTNEINNKVIVKEKNNYYVYIGISKKKRNLKKISDLYKEYEYNFYLKEEDIYDELFLSNLSQFDLMLEKAKDKDEINSINNVILSFYEEKFIKNGK